MSAQSNIHESRWVLYHGTSTLRQKDILRENRLRVSKPGDPLLSLTTERSVAEYFACLAAYTDRDDRPPKKGSNPVVLVIDGEGLLQGNYERASAYSIRRP
jgi:hypothetical protein